MGKNLKLTISNTLCPIAFSDAVASQASTPDSAAFQTFDARIIGGKRMPAFASRGRRFWRNAFCTAFAFSVLPRTFTATSAVAFFHRVVHVIGMPFRAMRNKGINSNVVFTTNNIFPGRDRLNVGGITTPSNSAQMVTQQITRDCVNKERVHQSVKRVCLAFNRYMSVPIQSMWIPNPTFCFVPSVLNRNVREKFCKQFQRNLDAVIIAGGHMLKHSPLVCGVVYGVDAS